MIFSLYVCKRHVWYGWKRFWGRIIFVDEAKLNEKGQKNQVRRCLGNFFLGLISMRLVLNGQHVPVPIKG